MCEKDEDMNSKYGDVTGNEDQSDDPMSSIADWLQESQGFRPEKPNELYTSKTTDEVIVWFHLKTPKSAVNTAWG